MVRRERNFEVGGAIHYTRSRQRATPDRQMADNRGCRRARIR